MSNKIEDYKTEIDEFIETVKVEFREIMASTFVHGDLIRSSRILAAKLAAMDLEAGIAQLVVLNEPQKEPADLMVQLRMELPTTKISTHDGYHAVDWELVPRTWVDAITDRFRWLRWAHRPRYREVTTVFHGTIDVYHSCPHAAGPWERHREFLTPHQCECWKEPASRAGKRFEKWHAEASDE